MCWTSRHRQTSPADEVSVATFGSRRTAYELRSSWRGQEGYPERPADRTDQRARSPRRVRPTAPLARGARSRTSGSPPLRRRGAAVDSSSTYLTTRPSTRTRSPYRRGRCGAAAVATAPIESTSAVYSTVAAQGHHTIRPPILPNTGVSPQGWPGRLPCPLTAATPTPSPMRSAHGTSATLPTAVTYASEEGLQQIVRPLLHAVAASCSHATLTTTVRCLLSSTTRTR